MKQSLTFEPKRLSHLDSNESRARGALSLGSVSKPCPTTPQQAGAIDLFDSAQGRPSIARIWVGASHANGLRSVRVDRPYLVYIRRFVRFLEDFREPWPVISGEELCYPPGYFDLMAKIKKRGRPRIRTAEYW